MMARKTKGFVLLLNIVFAGLVLFEMVKAGRKAGRKYGKYNTANTRALERAANFQPSVREAFKSQLQPQVASSPPPSDDNDVSLEGFGFGEADQALNEQQIIEADDISAHRKYYADQGFSYIEVPSNGNCLPSTIVVGAFGMPCDDNDAQEVARAALTQYYIKNRVYMLEQMENIDAHAYQYEMQFSLGEEYEEPPDNHPDPLHHTFLQYIHHASKDGKWLGCLDIAAYADMLDVAIYVYHAKDARNGTHRVTYWNHEDVPAQKLKEMHIAVSYHGRHFEAMIPPFKGDWDFCDLDITLLNDLLEKGSPGIEDFVREQLYLNRNGGLQRLNIDRGDPDRGSRDVEAAPQLQLHAGIAAGDDEHEPSPLTFGAAELGQEADAAATAPLAPQPQLHAGIAAGDDERGPSPLTFGAAEPGQEADAAATPTFTWIHVDKIFAPSARLHKPLRDGAVSLGCLDRYKFFDVEWKTSSLLKIVDGVNNHLEGELLLRLDQASSTVATMDDGGSIRGTAESKEGGGEEEKEGVSSCSEDEIDRRADTNRVKRDAVHGFFKIGNSIAKAHTLRGLFLQRLRDTVFMVNPEDLEQVLQTMQEEEGLTDEELTRRYYKCYGKLISKCRRKIGGVSMLLANYDRLIETWEGEKCVLTGKPLFNDNTKIEIRRFRRHIELGCFSDVPDVELYYYCMDACGRQKDLMKCQRGTNNVEGFHHHLRKVLAGFSVSPLFAEAIIAEFIYQWNVNQGITNRGDHDFGFYHHEILVEIQGLTAVSDQPLYDEYVGPDSYISTGEEFGILTQVAGHPDSAEAASSEVSNVLARVDIQQAFSSFEEFQSEEEGATTMDLSLFQGLDNNSWYGPSCPSSTTPSGQQLARRFGLATELLTPTKLTKCEEKLFMKLAPRFLRSGKKSGLEDGPFLEAWSGVVASIEEGQPPAGYTNVRNLTKPLMEALFNAKKRQIELAAAYHPALRKKDGHLKQTLRKQASDPAFKFPGTALPTKSPYFKSSSETDADAGGVAAIFQQQEDGSTMGNDSEYDFGYNCSGSPAFSPSGSPASQPERERDTVPEAPLPPPDSIGGGGSGGADGSGHASMDAGGEVSAEHGAVFACEGGEAAGAAGPSGTAGPSGLAAAGEGSEVVRAVGPTYHAGPPDLAAAGEGGEAAGVVGCMDPAGPSGLAAASEGGEAAGAVDPPGPSGLATTSEGGEAAGAACPAGSVVPLGSAATGKAGKALGTCKTCGHPYKKPFHRRRKNEGSVYVRECLLLPADWIPYVPPRRKAKEFKKRANGLPRRPPTCAACNRPLSQNHRRDPKTKKFVCIS